MYAVIDLGSNSFHLLIADYSGCGFSVVDRCSKKIQLADGLGLRGLLSQAAIERGISCLQFFKKILSQHPIKQLRVVATQALRQAVNAGDFIDQAAKVGFEIEIISGKKEAELIFRGICDPLPPCQSNRLVIDIGGASTEIAVGNDHDILFAESLHMGCISWRDRFFPDGIEYGRQCAEARQAAYSVLKPLLATLSAFQWNEVYASSGSAKMLATIARLNQWSEGDIRGSSIASIEEAISQVKRHDEISLKGLKQERQDLLAPGMCIMATIIECLNIDRIAYSSTALREGILGEISERRVGYQVPLARA
ncbi:MAG: Ppx/GppA family phosphatase [Cellvibrionaceae bacterium]